MVDIDRPQETAFLKASLVVERKIQELKIVTEPDWVDTVFEEKHTDKLQCEVVFSGQTKSDPTTWTMNKTSSLVLFDALGKDTKAWMDKPIPITVTGEGKKSAIMVDKIRLG